MKLFDVILKLIKTLTLVDSENYAILKNDVASWEDGATENNEDKMKSMYAKMHKGVFLRLAMPFLYFFLLKWVKDMTTNEDDLFE